MLLTGYSICLTLFILCALNLQHCLQEHTLIGNERFCHAAHAYHLSLFYFWVCPHGQITAVGHTEFESRRWRRPPHVKPRSGAPKRICPAGTEAPSGGVSEGDLWKEREKKIVHTEWANGQWRLTRLPQAFTPGEVMWWVFALHCIPQEIMWARAKDKRVVADVFLAPNTSAWRIGIGVRMDQNKPVRRTSTITFSWESEMNIVLVCFSASSGWRVGGHAHQTPAASDSRAFPTCGGVCSLLATFSPHPICCATI